MTGAVRAYNTRHNAYYGVRRSTFITFYDNSHKSDVRTVWNVVFYVTDVINLGRIYHILIYNARVFFWVMVEIINVLTNLLNDGKTSSLINI